jgi:hypothetical protein
MQVKLKVTVLVVRKKVSGQGNPYYQLDIQEELVQKDENDKPIKRNWNNIYFNPKDIESDVVGLMGKECSALVNFYPIDRQVGDKMYHDVKCNVLELSDIK